MLHRRARKLGQRFPWQPATPSRCLMPPLPAHSLLHTKQDGSRAGYDELSDSNRVQRIMMRPLGRDSWQSSLGWQGQGLRLRDANDAQSSRASVNRTVLYKQAYPEQIRVFYTTEICILASKPDSACFLGGQGTHQKYGLHCSASHSQSPQCSQGVLSSAC